MWKSMIVAVCLGVMVFAGCDLDYGLNRSQDKVNPKVMLRSDAPEKSDARGDIHCAGCFLMVPALKAVAASQRGFGAPTYSFEAGESRMGIEKLVSGEADLGLSSHALTDAQRKAHPELKAHLVGYDAIVFAVHPANSVTSITLEQVRSLYTGGIDTWAILDGYNAKPVVLSNRHGIYAYSFFCMNGNFDPVVEDGMMGYVPRGLATKPEFWTALHQTNADVMDVVSGNPHATGYLLLTPAVLEAEKAGRIKLLSVNGVPPNQDTVKASTYPFSRSLYILTRGDPEPAAAKFLTAVNADSGKAIMAHWGLLPAE